MISLLRIDDIGYVNAREIILYRTILSNHEPPSSLFPLQCLFLTLSERIHDSRMMELRQVFVFIFTPVSIENLKGKVRYQLAEF